MPRFPRLAAAAPVFAALILLAGSGTAAAGEIKAEWIAGSNEIHWIIEGPAGESRLAVAPPSGPVETFVFAPGETPVYPLRTPGGAVRPSGLYFFELQAAPVKTGEASGGGATDGRSAGAPAVEGGGSVSGTFSILDGAAIPPSAESEPAPAGSDPSGTISVNGPSDGISVNDQVIIQDLIVQASICAGFDCVNNEGFGGDTIRIKENNLQIRFLDTSTGAFPSADWQLTANDRSSGGASYFSIDDVTSGSTQTTPFKIISRAPTNAFYMNSNGDIGMNTSAPALDFQIKRSDTPAIRLEQDTSGGFTAQTWDMAGNEANFFIRDVTGGSKLSFRIRPGAPTSSIDIRANGAVAFGSTSISGSNRLQINALSDTSKIILAMDDSGNLEINGTLTESSDVNMKENFAAVDSREILAKVAELPVTTWNFKEGGEEVRHIGPMAQDFHAAFGVGSGETRLAPLDVNGVALAAIQGLDQIRREQEDRIRSQEERIRDLERNNAALADRLAALEALTARLAATLPSGRR